MNRQGAEHDLRSKSSAASNDARELRAVARDIELIVCEGKFEALPTLLTSNGGAFNRRKAGLDGKTASSSDR